MLQVIERSPLAAVMTSADEPTVLGGAWIETHWEAARLEAKHAGPDGAVLVLDEIQKVPFWSETVKRLWDEDTRTGAPLRVIVLGSSPLLRADGLTAMSGLALADAIADRSYWSRLVESAVGAHLVASAAAGDVRLSWWAPTR